MEKLNTAELLKVAERSAQTNTTSIGAFTADLLRRYIAIDLPLSREELVEAIGNGVIAELNLVPGDQFIDRPLTTFIRDEDPDK